MEVHLQNLSKRFNNAKWILKDLNFKFVSGRHYGISGPNGTGKSTLISLIAGLSMPTKGEVVYKKNEEVIEPTMWHRYFSMAAPYAELFDYFTIEEMIEFHHSFKPWKNQLNNREILELTKFKDHKDKLVKQLSSGMKQRLKLGLAILTDSSLLILDEPLTNLDTTYQIWYRDLLRQFSTNQCVIIASNDRSDFENLHEIIQLGL